MHYGLFINVIHVAGTKMQAQGTNELSRGSLSSGVLQGRNMLSYIPLHRSSLERSPTLQPWISTWFQSGSAVTFLDPLGLFTTGHQAGSYVWAPPPGAAEVALEQLAAAIHKRSYNLHLVVIPRLMTASWRKLLGKICDFIFTVPIGVSFWPESNHEPLLLGLYFPLLPFSPWQLRFTNLLDGLAQQLSSLPRATLNWGGGGGAGEFMVQDEEDEKRFLMARDGDNLVTPFQCDHCHFMNIMKREPLDDLASDVRLMKCIRRVNLVAFWSREPGTVRGVLDEMKRGLGIASQLGFAHALFSPRGPFPPKDFMGMAPAVVIVQRSLAKGRYGAGRDG